MKKVLSLTLALLMLMSCLGVTVAEAKEPKGVNTQLAAAADYYKANSTIITKVSGEVTFVNYNDYWLLLDAGCDMSDMKDDYLAGLKANLDKNNGKIVIEGTEWYQDEYDQWQSYSYSYEDISVYGSVITTLASMGLNPSNYEGYDITAPFKSFNLATITNPYSYRMAIYAAHEVLHDDEYTSTIVDDMISRFYTMGKGMDYYGFSCDNACHFVAALFPVATQSEYFAYIDDACGVIKSYTEENGARCDDVWAKNVNADSTALAVFAFASIQDIENANWYYQKLIDGFYNPATGAFQTDGADNVYATKDAVLGLSRFAKTATLMHVFKEPGTIRPASFNTNGSATEICSLCYDVQFVSIPAIDSVEMSDKVTFDGEAKKLKVVVKDVKGNVIGKENYTVTYKNNKKVGNATATVVFKNLYTGTVTLDFKILPKRTYIKKLTPEKNAFTVSWKKRPTRINGYQIQYSANKEFKNAKTITVKGNQTTSKKIAKLKANKKYFVRVRTFKTVDGKKYYSNWSSSKSVKVK